MESNKIFDDMESVFEATFKNWEILEDCTIVSKNRRYTIEGDRLLEQNWLNHILNKVGEQYDKEFYFVYLEALRRKGYKKITIDIVDKRSLISAE